VAPPLCNPQLDTYSYSESGSQAEVELRGLPPGLYDFYIYCLSNASGYNSGFGINVYGSLSAQGPGSNLTQSLPVQFTSPNPYDVTWTEGNQYVVQSGICVSAGSQVEIALQNGVQGTGNASLILSGVQMVRTNINPCE
jgi:hypothetical protein